MVATTPLSPAIDDRERLPAPDLVAFARPADPDGLGTAADRPTHRPAPA
jgi:hypothetical protein